MTRADVYLTQRGFAESRTRAARLIDEGKVLIDGKTVAKAGDKITDGDHDVVITQKDRFVSRGGLKLLAAIETFGIEVE
jgi:23S rRNA (cytidine1920-2'-O)/16S rRNA (cytidine1409-2'-O)-methyltransferase